MLNALRHQWFGHDIQEVMIRNGKGVLNALRHQWFGHQSQLTCSVVAGYVLNALRHQWFGHTKDHQPGKMIRCRAQRLTASMVWAPDSAGVTLAIIPVLNALRHQWFGHGNS